MQRYQWATALTCVGAMLIGYLTVEAQQYTPDGRVSGRTNPGVQAQPGATYRPATRGQTQYAATDGSRDAEIAALLALGNVEEIAMAQFAQDRAESEQVRDFAQMMIDEHTQLLNQLRRVQPEMVATYGRLSNQTAARDEERYDRRTTRRMGDEEEMDRDGGRRDDDFRRSTRSDRFDDESEFRGTQRGSNRASDRSVDEADFRRDRTESRAGDATGTDRTGSQTSDSAAGNRSVQPTGGDQDATQSGRPGNQTNTAGPAGTGAGSTGGIGTRTGSPGTASGSSGANPGGASGSGTGGTGGTGTGGTGAAGAGGTGSGGTGGAGAGAGGTGAGGGSGGAGSGGAGGGAGGSGGSGASLVPSLKTYPVVFQAGSQDENEDRQFPNRRTSNSDETEGTTIGPNAGGPRGGYNQESETQDGARERSSRSSRSSESRSYDADDYEDTRRGASQPSSRQYRDDDYRAQRRPSERSRYAESAETYDSRRAAASAAQVGMQRSAVNPASLLLQHQIVHHCLRNAKRELSDKEGADFDKAFMGMQIVAHNRMLAVLEASRDQASPQLARVIEEGIRSTEDHLEHAREIMRDLDRQ